MIRGDVVLVFVPNVGSPGGKLRPALIVQSDQNNNRLNETIIAALTSNVSRAHQSHQLLVDPATPDGRSSGLLHASAVRCERLQTVPQKEIRHIIGRLSVPLMLEIDKCLKASLGIA